MNNKIKYKNFLISILSGILILLLFSFINFQNGMYTHAFIEVGFAIATGFVAVLFFYQKISYTLTLYLCITFISIFYLYLFYHGGISQTGIMWSISFPVFAFMLSDKKNGILFSLIHLMMLVGIFFAAKFNLYTIPYDFISFRQMLTIYVLTSILSYSYQDKVEKSADLLTQFNNELQGKIDIAVKENKTQELQMFQQAKQAQMGNMISMIAHQWRQPLNALGLIIQKLQFMNSKGNLTTEVLDENVTKGMSIIDNMSKTINDFMNYLKVDNKRQDFTLDDVIDEILSIQDINLEKDNITLEFDIPQPITLHSFKNEFTHVISNLISNAIDAFEGKNITDKTITLSAIENEKEHLFQCIIKDNAGGIPEEIISEVFNTYFTTKEQGKGTGIGLNMSKRIIETLLKGTITVHNDKQGAVFTLQLPSN